METRRGLLNQIYFNESSQYILVVRIDWVEEFYLVYTIPGYDWWFIHYVYKCVYIYEYIYNSFKTYDNCIILNLPTVDVMSNKAICKDDRFKRLKNERRNIPIWVCLFRITFRNKYGRTTVKFRNQNLKFYRTQKTISFVFYEHSRLSVVIDIIKH